MLLPFDNKIEEDKITYIIHNKVNNICGEGKYLQNAPYKTIVISIIINFL